MISNYRHIILIITISVIFIIGGFWAINILYSDIIESLAVINYSQAIQKNPNGLQSDLVALDNLRANLQVELNGYESRKLPSLEILKDIAKKHDLKLIGIDLKRKLAIRQDQDKRYQLTFTGRITAVLNVLNQIENELILKIESIGIKANETNNKLVDFSILISIPEKKDEIE